MLFVSSHAEATRWALVTASCDSLEGFWELEPDDLGYRWLPYTLVLGSWLAHSCPGPQHGGASAS